MSLRTYCASRVGQPGNRSPKKSMSGDMIPISRTCQDDQSGLQKLPVTSVRPMKTSIIAVRTRADDPSIRPNVRVSTVRWAISSAGLALE